MYAAPEVLGPHMAGARTTHVAEAIDAWAVGILAIEIFTGQPVFDIFQGSEKVRGQQYIAIFNIIVSVSMSRFSKRTVFA